MRVLLFGSGGREHVFCHAFAKSNKVSAIYIAPGNAGTASTGSNVDLNPDDFEEVVEFILSKKIDLVVIGPEIPLVNGLANRLLSSSRLKGLKVLGPNREGAQLEGSKVFAKKFMKRYEIPTAKYLEVTRDNLNEGNQYLQNNKGPYVLKADGLAAGKGVLIVDDREQAKTELDNMLDGKFGEASKKVVIEEFLTGTEFSVFVLTDGDHWVLLPEAKDYKRAKEGDQGLNTGGMGAVSPVPFFGGEFKNKVIQQVVEPTLDGLKKEGIDYCGFIFFGLINVNGSPYVIEYNCRMGDPETQVVFPRIESDIAELILKATEGRLKGKEIKISSQSAATVIATSEGYPEKYEKGKFISGLDSIKNTLVFHAGTRQNNNSIVTNGGRVLAITCLGEELQTAVSSCYKNMNKLCFEGITYRKDIGSDLIN